LVIEVKWHLLLIEDLLLM